MLVVAPLSLLEAAWREDGIKFSYTFSFLNAHDDFNFNGGYTITAINYESLLVKSGKIIESLKGGEWLCVLDESSKINNYTSQITKLLLKMAPLFKHRIVMTGTPAPNTDLEYWPQMQFVKPGCLGTSMTAFRSHFFHLQNRYTGVTMPIGRFATKAMAMETFRKCDYVITKQKREELMKYILPLCHMAKKKDCLDLPDQIDEIRQVELGPAHRRAYYEMEKYLVLEIQDQQIAAPVALTKLIKLRQIVSGFLYSESGEALEISAGEKLSLEITGDEKKMVRVLDNPKLNELFSVIEDAGDQPIIIWIQFHWEQIKICHDLEKKYPVKPLRFQP